MTIVIRKCKDVRRFPRGAASRKPSRLGGAKPKMYFSPFVDMAGCNGIVFESTQRWVECDIAEAVAT